MRMIWVLLGDLKENQGERFIKLKFYKENLDFGWHVAEKIIYFDKRKTIFSGAKKTNFQGSLEWGG